MDAQREESRGAAGKSGSRVRSALAGVLAVAVGAVIVLMGCEMAARGWRTGYFQLVTARAWRPVEAQVIARDIKTHAGRDRISYEPIIIFQYHLDGAAYTSSTYRAIDAATDSREEAERILYRYRTGGTYTAWYDPSLPSQAVLERSGGYAFVVPLVLGLFVLVPVGILAGWAGVSFARCGERSRKTLGRGQGGQLIEPQVESGAGTVGGAIAAAAAFALVLTLRNEGAPLGETIGWIIIISAAGIIFAKKMVDARRALKHRRQTAGMALRLHASELRAKSPAQWELLDPRGVLAGPTVRAYIVYSRGTPDVMSPGLPVLRSYKESIREITRGAPPAAYSGTLTVPRPDILPLESAERPGRWYFAVTDGMRQLAFALEVEPEEGQAPEAQAVEETAEV